MKTVRLVAADSNLFGLEPLYQCMGQNLDNWVCSGSDICCVKVYSRSVRGEKINQGE